MLFRSLEIAAGKTVSAYVGTNTNEKQALTVSGTALLSGTATLNTSLTMMDGATLEMNNLDAGAVTLSGALTFSGSVAMGENLQAIVNELNSWGESVTLFTGLTDVVSLPSTLTSAGDMVLASEVFSNVQNKQAYISYQVINNVGSLMVVNVPEPTTTALSLLALCGLAARRRRK